MEEEALEEEFSIMREKAERTKILDSNTFQKPVKHLKAQKPVTLEAHQSVREAITLMQVKQFGCAVITRRDKLIGIMTERDVISKALIEGHSIDTMKIEEIMTPDPESVQLDDSIAFVMNMMHVGGYRHVPVVDETNVPIAVVSVKDVIGFIVENFPEEILNVPPHPVRRVDSVDGG